MVHTIIINWEEIGNTLKMMTLELDHVFICVAPNAPAAEQLVTFGLTEGSANVHLG
jgi:hypothetical protein